MSFHLTSARDWRRAAAAAVIAALMGPNVQPAAAQVAAPEQPAAAIDPFGTGAGAAPRPAEPGKAASTPTEPQPEPLAIDLLRRTDPQTPVDLLRAARAALDFGRPDESKRYLAKLLASSPGDEAWAAQALAFGDFLLRIARHKEVQPEGKQVAEQAAAASQRVAASPELIGKLVSQLASADKFERQQAMLKLSQAGSGAVPLLVAALADPQRAKEHVYIQAALVRLGERSVLPLVGALETADAGLKARLIETLGHTGSRWSVAFLIRDALAPSSPAEVREAATAALARLVGAVPSAAEGQKVLWDETAKYWRGDLPFALNADDQAQYWRWDAAGSTLVAQALSKGELCALLTSRLAREQLALQPEDAATQRLMHLALLEYAQSQAGLAQSLPGELVRSMVSAFQGNAGAMSQVLAEALAQKRVAAAIGAIEVLEKVGNASVLQGSHGGLAPLAEAVRFSDRRVRYRAAVAAAKLRPKGDFAGASYMRETLAWLAGARGPAQAIVADTRRAEVQSIVALFQKEGLEGIAAHTGREVMAAALASADLECIFVDDAIDSPPVLELVQWLRRDFRTARVPVAVLARVERIGALDDRFADDPFTLVAARVHGPETAALVVQRLRGIAGRNFVDADERRRQAAAAGEALARLKPVVIVSVDPSPESTVHD